MVAILPPTLVSGIIEPLQMYLGVTGNLKRKITRVTLPDGTERVTEEEYYPPSLSSLTALFRVGKGSEP